MNQEILDFIKSQRIGVLAVEMLDGSPHGATVHFAHQDNPVEFFFLTDREDKKCEPILARGKTRASVVIGFDEATMKTLQLDGEVKIVESEDDKKRCFDAYFGKFPEKKKWMDDKDSVFLSFMPTWWRYTDYKKPKGEKIIISEDK
jgi:uncharacterized protein YhbP (UPF0306 family)